MRLLLSGWRCLSQMGRFLSGFNIWYASTIGSIGHPIRQPLIGPHASLFEFLFGCSVYPRDPDSISTKTSIIDRSSSSWRPTIFVWMKRPTKQKSASASKSDRESEMRNEWRSGWVWLGITTSKQDSPLQILRKVCQKDPEINFDKWIPLLFHTGVFHIVREIVSLARPPN